MAPKSDEESTAHPELEKTTPQHQETSDSTRMSAEQRRSSFISQIENNANAALKNPLAGMSKEELIADVEEFAAERGLMDEVEYLKKGALVAQNPKQFEFIDELTEDEKETLRRETTHRWSQPWMMYFMTGEFLLLGGSLFLGYTVGLSVWGICFADGYMLVSSLCWFGYCARHGSNHRQWRSDVSPHTFTPRVSRI